MASLDVAPRHNRGRRPSAISLLTGMSEMIGSRKRPAIESCTAQTIEMLEASSDIDHRDACTGIAAKRIMALQNQFNNVDKPKEAPPPMKVRTWSTEKREVPEIRTVIPEIRKDIPEIRMDVPEIRVEEAPSNQGNWDEFLQSSPEGRNRLKEISSMFDRGLAKPIDTSTVKDTDNGTDKENTEQTSPGDTRRPPWASVPGRGQTSQVCCICGEVTYILERQSKDGHFFHRQCCTCATCHCTLRIGSLYIHETRRQVKFFCFKHANESGHFTPRRRKSVAAIAARRKMDLTDDSSVPAIHIDMHDDGPTDKKDHMENGGGEAPEKRVRFNTAEGESKVVTVEEDLCYPKWKDSNTNHDNGSNGISSPEVSVISHFKPEYPGTSQSGDRHVSFTTLTFNNHNSAKSEAHHSTTDGQRQEFTSVDEPTGHMQADEESLAVAAVDNNSSHQASNGDILSTNTHHDITEADPSHDQTPHTCLDDRSDSADLYPIPTVCYNARSDDTASAYHTESGDDDSDTAIPNGTTPSAPPHVRFALPVSSDEEAHDQPRNRIDVEIPSARELVQPNIPTEVMESMATHLDDMHMNGSDTYKNATETEDDGFSTETDSPGFASPGMASSGSPSPESSEVESEAEQDEDDTLETTEEGVQEDDIPPSHYDRKDSDITGDWVPRRVQSAQVGDRATQDEAPVVLRRKSRSAESKRKRPASTVYRHSTSIRLLMAHEIQSGLEDVDQQEEALEERGRHVEEVLRGFGEEVDPDQEELLEEWMEVLQQKQELRNKEIRLLLKKKLLDLQEQKKQLKRAMEDTEDQEGILEELEQLDDDMADVRSELAELTAHIRESQTNLCLPNFGETKGESLV